MFLAIAPTLSPAALSLKLGFDSAAGLTGPRSPCRYSMVNVVGRKVDDRCESADGLDESPHRAFIRGRLEGLRALFRAGRGAWYVAIEPATGVLVASCGIVVAAGRGRFQLVDTAPSHRRPGISSRLGVEAARRARIEQTRFVIEADPGYHAIRLYESLGFERAEVVGGACLWQRAK
jgi:GNAT superfamily N-acetyltransferase